MKKLVGMIALAAISLGSVYAYGNPVSAKTGVIQQDTTKKKVKQKGEKTKKKMKTKKDSVKKDTVKM